MSKADLSMAAFRDRRSQRLPEALALYGGDPVRQRLLGHLSGVADTLGADRAAVLWVDEYGTGLVHTRCVFDLAAQPPRDDFRIDPLRLSWNEGVPGLVDIPDSVRGQLPFLKGRQSACYVALGSDGTRAWFLTADSSTARQPITGKTLDDLMFQAGEVASVVLHMDLAEKRPLRTAVGGKTVASESANPPGWPILEDLVGRESEDGLDRRIGTRFAVAQMLRTVIEEDFVLAWKTLSEKLTELRKGFDVVGEGDPERQAWVRVANAIEAEDRLELARAVFGLGRTCIELGHHHGAMEVLTAAYAVSVSVEAYWEAIEASRNLGMTARRLGQWDTSFAWFEVAIGIAEAYDVTGRLAVALSGRAGTYRERGNLPAARKEEDRALALAEQAADPYALGYVHHGLMTVKKLAGQHDEAIGHGWTAVTQYPTEEDRLRALTDLAWAFVEVRELSAAEDAYSIVAHRSQDFTYRVYALDALAYIESLRGDREAFERRLEAVDASGWRNGPRYLVAELLLYRGKAYKNLGAADKAEPWLEEARSAAQETGNHQLVFDAERLLAEVAAHTDVQDGGEPMVLDHPNASPAIVAELKEMRRTLVPT